MKNLGISVLRREISGKCFQHGGDRMKNDAEVDLPGVTGSDRVKKKGMTGAHVLERPEVRKSESPKVRKSESPKVRKSESPKVQFFYPRF